jgi:energy-coupling factor transporter ATP-binding protein EcfA2
MGLICPASQGGEAAWAGDVDVIAAPDLLALLNHLKGTQLLSPPERSLAELVRSGPDMAEIKGQETAKRAIEIAAAGGHNLLMSGPPGSGKSLLAAALPGILPELTPAEALEVSMVASMAGELEGGRLVRTRPFRSPHHSASMPALVGGGMKARPGEVSLAHLGVLFLDELPEFDRHVLEVLREPLESGKVILQSRREVAGAASLVRANAELARYAAGQLAPTGALPGGERDLTWVERVPLGVIVCVIPFNFPVELTMEKAAAAIAAGNVAIIKPPPQNPLATIEACRLLGSALPDGVLQVLPGGTELSAALCAGRGPGCRMRTGRWGRSCSLGRPGWARPS